MVKYYSFCLIILILFLIYQIFNNAYEGFGGCRKYTESCLDQNSAEKCSSHYTELDGPKKCDWTSADILGVNIHTGPCLPTFVSCDKKGGCSGGQCNKGTFCSPFGSICCINIEDLGLDPSKGELVYSRPPGSNTIWKSTRGEISDKAKAVLNKLSGMEVVKIGVRLSGIPIEIYEIVIATDKLDDEFRIYDESGDYYDIDTHSWNEHQIEYKSDYPKLAYIRRPKCP